MIEDNIIRIEVNGITVEGEITHRSDWDIVVVITKPYSNLYDTLHIPFFARPSRSFLGETGDQTAERLLKNLYTTSHHLHQNMDQLKRRYRAVKKKIENLTVSGLTYPMFLEKRKEMRKQLRSGEINGHAYQQELVAMRKRVRGQSSEVNEIMMKFFTQNFGQSVHAGQVNQILKILEGEQHIRQNSPGTGKHESEHPARSADNTGQGKRKHRVHLRRQSSPQSYGHKKFGCRMYRP